MHKAYTTPKHYLYKDYYRFSISEHRTRWGRITIDGKKQWATDILVPLVMLVIYPGHSKVATGVDIKDEYLLDAINEYSKKFNPQPTVVNSEQYINTLVNRKSLEAFVNAKDTNIVDRRVAKTILASLDKDDYFKQEIKQPVVNRTYLLGVNLQQVKKSVRAAALSGQWAYDVNCAVFALFASVAHELTNKSYPTIQAYIVDRAAIRSTISSQTGLTVDEVKQVLISVGFGKRAKNANNLAVVLTTPIGNALVKEFRQASSVVYRYFKDEKPRGKRLAELFFTWESELVREFIYRSRQEANLTIHDSIVMLKPVDTLHILDIMKLSFTTHTEYFNFTEEEIGCNISSTPRYSMMNYINTLKD
jgi:hypothetical protein